MMEDELTEQYKSFLRQFWCESEKEFSFALSCYIRGRIDEARIAEPSINDEILERANENDHLHLLGMESNFRPEKRQDTAVG